MAYIIAEVGFNHEGNIDVAIEMVKAASDAGANAVKFQTFRAFDIALPTADHFEAIKCGEMNFEQHLKLSKVAKDCGIEFISTPYSPWAVEILEKVGVPAYKVASMDLTNRYLLKYIAQTSKPIYLSTGMATLPEIAKILEYLRQEGSGPITLLHCLSLYPPRATELNLAIIPFFKHLFATPVGYSDHYPGTKACLAAAMFGAEVIETHFSLNPSKEGADHHHSVDPTMLSQLISDIVLFKKMKGNRQEIFNRSDLQWSKHYRRGIYAAKNLKKGKKIHEDDLLFCRPASQLSPTDLQWLKGKSLIQDVDAYEAIIKEFFIPNS